LLSCKTEFVACDCPVEYPYFNKQHHLVKANYLNPAQDWSSSSILLVFLSNTFATLDSLIYHQMFYNGMISKFFILGGWANPVVEPETLCWWHHSLCLGAMSSDQIYSISNYDFGRTKMWIFLRSYLSHFCINFEVIYHFEMRMSQIADQCDKYN
jgi:hypothetical protein